ncbi:hypothetical protein BHE74_00054789, partial [Ensete ventricosum]
RYVSTHGSNQEEERREKEAKRKRTSWRIRGGEEVERMRMRKEKRSNRRGPAGGARRTRGKERGCGS